MKVPIIAASLTHANWGSFTEEVTNVVRAGAEWIHVDIMDGHFLPRITAGADLLRAVKDTANTTIDAHLMVSNPEAHLEAFVEAGANIITVHQSTCEDPLALIEKTHQLGAKAGIALFPEDDLLGIKDLLGKLDLLLLIVGRDEFLPNAQQRIDSAAKLIGQEKHIPTLEVSGGIDQLTAPLAMAAGADVLVAGDFIFQHESYKDAIKALKGL